MNSRVNRKDETKMKTGDQKCENLKHDHSIINILIVFFCNRIKKLLIDRIKLQLNHSID